MAWRARARALRRAPMTSPPGQAPVHMEGLARNVGGLLGAEEGHYGRYVFGTAQATQGDELQEIPALLLIDKGDHVRVHKAAGDSVTGDAAGGHLPGHGLGKAYEARLGGYIVGLAGAAHNAADAADVDDAAPPLPQHILEGLAGT